MLTAILVLVSRGKDDSRRASSPAAISVTEPAMAKG